MDGIDAEIAMIPLAGHSRGHVAIAIREGDRWLLHCGDSHSHHGERDQPPSCPPMLRAFQALTAFDNAKRVHNAERLRELAGTHGDEVTMFCAHDPHDLRTAQAAAAQAS